MTTSRPCAGHARRAVGRSRPARRRSRGRARDAPRRALHRPPARRHGGGDHQGGAAGQAGPAAGVGEGPLQGALALVAGAVAQQEVRDAQPAHREGPGASARPGEAERRARRELPPRHAREVEPRLGAAQRGQPAAHPLPGLRLRPDRPVRAARRLRLGRGGDGRHPPHQRLPGRAAAPDAHLARRLARGDVRRAGDPRRALPPRRARRRARPGRRRLAARVLLRAARERRARVRPAGHRPRAGRHRAEGRGPLQHLQVRATTSGS